MSQLMNELHQDHQQISVLLTILKNKLATLEAGARPNFGLLSEVVDYLSDYAGGYHHGREDRFYLYLMEHYPEVSAIVNQQLAEHEELALLTQELDRATQAAMMDAPLPLDDFTRLLRRFIEKQQHHLTVEENKVFPAAMQHLTRDDWRVLSELLPKRVDPLTEGTHEQRYSELTQALIEDLA